jgi:hypothetical protein
MDRHGTVRIRPLANDGVIVSQTPDPQTVFCASPGLCRLPSGRLIATTDWRGPGMERVPGPTFDGHIGESALWQGRVYASDDQGRTWQQKGFFNCLHARPFVAGHALYVLGHAGDLRICRSDDEGETWSDVVNLTDGQRWHQAPCNVHYANGCVYLVMEQWGDGFWVARMAPVLMRARVGDDLTRRENWTFATPLVFADHVPDRDLDWFGMPFFPYFYPDRGNVEPGRWCDSMGWLETNVVQFVDPAHYWYDPAGKTYHLWMRAHTGGTGYACMLKVVEQGDRPGTGAMATRFETVPSGRNIVFVPCPGGQMKFHVLYDALTQLYWLLSTQATDSMRRADRLPAERFNLPNNERRRLVLHFSRNMIDWCFAGVVAIGPVELASRHYAAMVIDGDDLQILSRSGTEQARTPHDGNIINAHRIAAFRDLVY